MITGGEKPSVGVDLRPTGLSAPYLVAFECGGSTGTLEGSVIAKIGPIGAMELKSTVTYSEHAGLQIPEKFESGLKDTLFGGEQGGLKTKATIANPEKLEIKAIA